MPLRVNLVTGPFLPAGSGPSGAVEKLWFGVAREFVRQGHQVTFAARSWPEQKNDETIDGVNFLRRSGFTRSKSVKKDLLKDAVYSLRMLRALPSADITVTNTFWLPILARLRKHALGKIVVNVARFPKGQMKLYQSVDRLSAVSSAVADEIFRQTPSVKNLVRVVPNPVDLDRFRVSDNQLSLPGSYRVLYTGRIHPEKGLHLLIQAIRQLRDEFPLINLSIVGPDRVEHGGGGDAYMMELKKLAHGLPVTFEPSIDDPVKLAERMAESDYYCYPSLADLGESFGVAPVEAMALGYAPILSKLACFREFAEDGVNSFIFDHRHGDPVGNLTFALRKAIDQPKVTYQMGQNAAELVQKFSYEKIAQSYIDDWRELLSSG